MTGTGVAQKIQVQFTGYSWSNQDSAPEALLHGLGLRAGGAVVPLTRRRDAVLVATLPLLPLGPAAMHRAVLQLGVLCPREVRFAVPAARGEAHPVLDGLKGVHALALPAARHGAYPARSRDLAPRAPLRLLEALAQQVLALSLFEEQIHVVPLLGAVLCFADGGVADPHPLSCALPAGG